MHLENDLAALVPRLASQMPENVQLYIITRYLKKVVCDMIFGLGFAADWEIARNLTLSPGYAFEFRDSDAIGFDYRVHRLFLDLIYRF